MVAEQSHARKVEERPRQSCSTTKLEQRMRNKSQHSLSREWRCRVGAEGLKAGPKRAQSVGSWTLGSGGGVTGIGVIIESMNIEVTVGTVTRN